MPWIDWTLTGKEHFLLLWIKFELIQKMMTLHNSGQILLIRNTYLTFLNPCDWKRLNDFLIVSKWEQRSSLEWHHLSWDIARVSDRTLTSRWLNRTHHFRIRSGSYYHLWRAVVGSDGDLILSLVVCRRCPIQACNSSQVFVEWYYAFLTVRLVWLQTSVAWFIPLWHRFAWVLHP